MSQINNIIEYFKNIQIATLIDIAIMIGITIVFKLLSSKLAYLSVKVFKFKEKDKNKIKSNGFYKPLKLFFSVLGLYLGICILNLDAAKMLIVNKGFRIITIIILANGFANIATPQNSLFKKIKERANIKQDEGSLNIVSKIIKTIIYVIAGFMILMELNYDLSGLITGLGLGGVVVALAAQDVAKSLFAGFSILADKSFSVGDWISTSEVEGSVEDITFRSTKIRTNDDTLITIPNSVLAQKAITNTNKMNKRRFKTELLLSLEVSENTLERLTQKLEFVLTTVDKVIENTQQVKVDKISKEGINILIYLYTSAVPYEEFIEFKNVVNKEIIKVLKSEEIKLAYPGNNVYIMNK